MGLHGAFVSQSTTLCVTLESNTPCRAGPRAKADLEVAVQAGDRHLQLRIPVPVWENHSSFVLLGFWDAAWRCQRSASPADVITAGRCSCRATSKSLQCGHANAATFWFLQQCWQCSVSYSCSVVAVYRGAYGQGVRVAPEFPASSSCCCSTWMSCCRRCSLPTWSSATWANCSLCSAKLPCWSAMLLRLLRTCRGVKHEYKSH